MFENIKYKYLFQNTIMKIEITCKILKAVDVPILYDVVYFYWILPNVPSFWLEKS